ncbi:MAG: transpeptidase family protein, partial [Bacteroidota bacterium]|nr:transpeptidase family protein [Bacteroidota bacterium]
AFFIQHVQGNYWKALSDSLHQKYVDLSAERGTIYSEDGNMLSTSVPYFNIYIDFDADGLREKNGKRFKENLDSLSLCLASLFRDKSATTYKKQLLQGYKADDRYYLLQRNLTFDQYKKLRTFPLVRQGRNKSGFIIDASSKRMNPFGLLANRTIGLSRDNAQNVGLERTYDGQLRGENGRKLVRYLNGGTYTPVEGYEIDPENGKDIFTTIDVNKQDIAENALLSMMIENECEHGTCVVMETATGKIKAMANLGRQPDGSYWEDLNYAIRASEPGSTFKLATLLSLLDDHEVKLSDRLNIEGGTWKIGTRTVHDAEKQEVSNVTVEEAFEHSSNVGMAKLVVSHYSHNPQKFVDNIKRLRLNQITGIDLAGETSPIVKSPKSRTWSASTLPWMAFGYEVLVSPLQTLTLYNAVANNGRMMKPYLVNSVQYAGGMDRQFQPVVLMDKVCSDETLADLKTCLEGVCIRGTAKTTLKNTFYPVAGKTGTALIANGNRGYADHIYQSSFAGYFPADHPRYSCIVVIRNKPFAKKYLGAQVAGPVFREVADKLMSLDVQMADSIRLASYTSLLKKDSSAYYYAGESDGIKKVFHTLQMNYADSSRAKRWSGVYRENNQPVIKAKNEEQKQIPDVKGMGLKDALFLLESKDIKVTTRGTGKVKQQSIPAGSIVSKNQKLILDLN